jgi:hypothetical protein
LTPEELYQLNLYFSYQIELALTSGKEAAKEEQSSASPSKGRSEIDLRDLEGAAVVAEDRTFLGLISTDRYDIEPEQATWWARGVWLITISDGRGVASLG